MDKENGENTEGGTSSSKLSNAPDPSTLLDAASLFAYWPRTDNPNAAAAANAANMFASTAGGYGLGAHPSLPFGLLPTTTGRGMSPYPTSTTAAAAYNNAYTNTLSVAASQAASLGIPAASAAWWSMASHLAAQDYLARIQATGLNFPGLSNPADLPYSSLGLSSLSAYQKSSKNAKNFNSSSLPKSQQGSTSKSKGSISSHSNIKADGSSVRTSSPMSYSKTTTSSTNAGKFSSSPSLTIQPSMKLPTSSSNTNTGNTDRKTSKVNDVNYSKTDKPKNSSPKLTPPVSSIFTNPLSLANNFEKNSVTTTTASDTSTIPSGLPTSILSAALEGNNDPSTILGGVRLPPDTEIIKYTSSIVGPKIPGTTNRGRKKTISLDPPSVSVHPSLSSGSMHIERAAKRPKLSESQDSSTLNASNDRVEVIKLAPTNGSPVMPNSTYNNNNSGFSESIGGDTPLNLSMKPSSTNLTSSSLNSLSNMSASLGVDRIYSPRSPTRLDDSLSTTTAITSTSSSTIGSLPIPIHKDGRPRNLGRGISKPKKNTVASLLAQSRALGIKPMQVLDPNASMNQQITLLKSNILAAQQLMVEAGGDEKTFNKLLQEKFRGALSDSNSSTVDASTDSDNLTDSNHTDSEMETDSSVTVRKPKHFDERALKVPLDRGWKRETVIRGLGKNGNIKGDVIYIAPDSSNKFKQMSDITQYLDYQENTDLTKENFTFSSRVILGDYLQPVPSGMVPEGGEFIRLTEDDVNRRLEELKSVTRTNLAVEQRIEVARRQQAARAQARMEKEQARLQREMERSERQEAARREREARSQQLLEERERRRQHIALVKALENRRKLEERERKKQQALAEKQASKEKKLEQRRIELEILTELRKPCEDLELDQKPLPEYDRIPGLKISGKAFADILMVFEFLHNFGETLGFDMESLPTLDSLQQALLYNDSQMSEAEEELLSVMTHLLVCAIEDPGIPNPARHTTSLGQTLRQADITHANLSEILRIYLYANATGEVKALTGVHFEREREKRVADHHQNGCEMMQTMQFGKNVTYYELLHDNATWKMSDMLKDKPFLALSPTDKAGMLAFICNELLQNKAVIRQIDSSLESVTQLKKERWILDAKIRKLRMLHNRKVRTEAVEKVQTKPDGIDAGEPVIDFPTPHKDELLDDEENEMSENESVGTQPEEEEDNKLSGEELGKKLEKFVKQSEVQLHSLNHSTQQLRANCFGQDRYWRRYWSLPKAGGIFVEAIESTDPEVLKEQQVMDIEMEAKMLPDDEKPVLSVEHEMPNSNVDKEVCTIVSKQDVCEVVDVNKITKENEHRKTPNRLEVVENGDVNDQCERSLDELRKSVEKIVQSLDSNVDFNQGKNNCNANICDTTRPPFKLELNHVDGKESHNHVDLNIKMECDEEHKSVKKLNIFEKLGECMERENKTEEELKVEVKAEVKEELKNEILNELKSEIKTEYKHEVDDVRNEGESKWFSILSKDGLTCEGTHLTQGNRWDTGVGACSRENLTELKIPVFPPPNNSSSYLMNSCDSPGPLQMTAEESVQLEYIKKHGLPKPCDRKVIPADKRFGWWRIKELETLKIMLENLHVRGARERELKRTFLSTMQSMYESQGKLHIEEGQKDATDLSISVNEYSKLNTEITPCSNETGSWSDSVAHRVDTFLFEQVEALEDKVANASMQVKGWRIPNREGTDVPMGQLVVAAKERLASLEAAIERRYLKPPLGISTGDPNLAAIAQEAAGVSVPSPFPCMDEIPKGLAVWREAVSRAQTSAQLAMCLYTLEASIAWDKSIMKANCQFCHNGDNEDKLLLCDGCDKGYHTYCFKPKMENIPEGDWYCHECMNKATGERNCIVCGKKQSTTGTRLLLCELCPRAYHTDCLRPALNKAPRGKWYCLNCISKKPQKRTVRKSNTPKTRDSESSDHPPASPAPSHSSATTNEDQQQLNDLNNLSNAGSPSTQVIRKERVSKKLIKELAPCKAILEDLECHDDAWPFLLPVNTKQFPTYKKIIKNPMDLSSIKKRLQDVQYKSREEFVADVRQIFNNCETFNEDDSPVGKAGHCMRQFFESRWNELCLSHS